MSYRQECSRPIRLQGFFRLYYLKKELSEILNFCKQSDINGSYKLIISVWVCGVRHVHAIPKVLRNHKFLGKDSSDCIDFCMQSNRIGSFMPKRVSNNEFLISRKRVDTIMETGSWSYLLSWVWSGILVKCKLLQNKSQHLDCLELDLVLDCRYSKSAPSVQSPLTNHFVAVCSTWTYWLLCDQACLTCFP